MQKKRNTKSIDVGDIVTGVFCFAGMAIALILFWNDLNISFAKSNEQKIAVIYFKYNTAQRRLQNRNVWERLQQSSPIYNGDRIRTAAASEAYTIFNDGTRLDLHENTLIQVFSTKKGNGVQFIDGAISVMAAPAAPKMTVVTGKKAISFDENTEATFTAASETKAVTAVVTSGAISVAEAPKEQIAPKLVSYLSGSADLFKSVTNSTDVVPEEKQPEQEAVAAAPQAAAAESAVEQPVAPAAEQKISAGSTYTFSMNTAQPVVQKKEEQINVYMPTTTYSLIHQPGETAYLPVTWNSNEDVELRFSRTNNFDQPLGTQILAAGEQSIRVPLDFAAPEDTIYWRAAPVTPGNGPYPSGVVFVRLPEQKSIADIASQAFGKEQSVAVQTKVEEADKKIAVAAAEAPKAAEPVAEAAEPVPAAETVVPEVNETSPAEPVAAIPAPAVEPAPEPAPAKKAAPVKKAAPAKPAPVPAKKTEPAVPALVSLTPSPTAPAKGKVFSDADFSSDDPSIGFAWTSVKGAQSYSFTLYAGTKKVLSRTVKTASYKLSGDAISILENGTYKWTVTASQKANGQNYDSKTSESIFVVKISALGNVEIDKSNLINAQ